MNQHKSVYNWLGLALLAFVVLGLCYLTMSGRPENDESPVASSQASSQMVTPVQTAASTQPSPSTLSPLAASAQLASPLSADLASPLPKPAPSSNETTSPFELTVLHTNDTWGYLSPCG